MRTGNSGAYVESPNKQHSEEVKLAGIEAGLKQLEKQNTEQKLQLQEAQLALLVQKEHSGKLEEKLRQVLDVK